VCSDVSEECAVVRAQLHLYCFPHKRVHAPKVSGEDCGDTRTRNLQLQILQTNPKATEKCRMYWTEDDAQE
jgi:hypothetical protein